MFLHPKIIYTDERAREKQFLRGSSQAAGYDLSIFPRGGDDEPLDGVSIEAGQTSLIHTGVRLWIGDEGGDFFGMVVPRSSVGHKLNIMLGNTTGIIDSDYQGELLLSLHNRGATMVKVQAGDRMAQIIFVPYQRVHFHAVDAYAEISARGAGGYGSTGR